MKKIIIFLFVIILFGSPVWAEIPERPEPPRLVNDFAGVLNSNENKSLENVLEKFARETSTQIVVVTVADLEGYDRSEYAFEIGEKWGIGQKGKDNGIVMLVKPKKGNSRGQVFVATGYGLEAVLPDATVNRSVVNNEMIPRFKTGDYYGGIAAGAKVIMAIARGEYTAEQYQESISGGGAGIPVFFIFFALIVFILSRSRKNRFYSPGKSLPFWIAMGMLSGSQRSSGSFSDFSSGGGSFGGFSGGGFGGFGGGSFGGGGAGGSW